jgi:hypothetical protein
VLAAAIGIVAAWLRSARLAVSSLAMAATTGAVALVAHANTAIAIQLVAFAALLWLGSTEPELRGGP